MLQKLNEKIKGVVAWVIVILIAITFTLFGVDYYIQSHGRSNAEVYVNGEEISKITFENNYRRLKQGQDLRQLTPSHERAMKQQVLDEMIVNAVTVQAAKKAGFQISTAQANAAISAIPQFQVDGRFSLERYQQAISGAMFTPESFLQEVKQGMLINQVRFGLMGTSFVLPSELNRFVKLFLQSRDYQYMVLPYAPLMASVTVDEKAIAEYYQANKAAFKNPEKLAIDYVILSNKSIRDAVHVSAEQLHAFYKENEASFKLPAQWRVAQIYFAFPEGADQAKRAKIMEKAASVYAELEKDPAKFSEMVQAKSDDKLSLAKGGELPWITAGQTFMDKGLVALTKTGQISKPFEGPRGIQIFKLLEYKPAKIKSFAEVQSNIQHQLVAEKAQKTFSTAMETMTELAFQSPDSLQSLSTSLKLPIQSSTLFSREGTKEGVASNKLVVETAFSNDVLRLKNNSEPLQLNNDEIAVIRVKEHIPASDKPLKEVHADIEKQLRKQGAMKKAASLGEQFIKQKLDFSQLSTAFSSSLRWKEVKDASRESNNDDAAIMELAFAIPKANQLQGHENAEGNFVVVQLKKIKDGQLSALSAEQKAALLQQLEASYGAMDYDLYVGGLMKKADIQRDETR